MPRYYFDYRGPALVIDHDGIDLADQKAAEWLALELLGETIIGFARGPFTKPVEVDVRDEQGPILRVSATIDVKDARPRT
ncbi:hypothetical protein ABID65_007638 [Bradyrhizobium sp. S3.9.2]|uniref:DUF6894 family protein n=1 Tax=unclassified Bradyrhizobium TaxID=2631580 RepID=UPI003397870D